MPTNTMVIGLPLCTLPLVTTIVEGIIQAPPAYVLSVFVMMKGWRDGEWVTKVVGDAKQVGMAARPDGIVAVGGKVPPMISN